MIEAAERILTEEGCAALTAGKLAQCVGLSRLSVHYYFGTIDELIVAVLDRRGDILHAEIADLPERANPLRAAWERRARATTFTFEIMVLGLRRPLVKEALHRHLLALRSSFSRSIKGFFERVGTPPPLEPDAMATAFLAVSQAITMDISMGIDTGHRALVQTVETWLDVMDGLTSEATQA
ncbi:MAG: helix-turn-helix domain-containing protein [Sphingobium sp.]